MTRGPRDERLIALGVVMGSHGVHGELRVKPLNEDSDLLPSLSHVLLEHGGTTRKLEVESVRVGSKGLLFALRGVDTPEQAKALHGAELCIDRSELPELAPGEYYFVDLPGLAAHTPDGAAVGEVERVQEYPASSVLCVRTSEGVLEVPMVAPYLLSVDVAAGRVVVDRLEDLRDEPPRKKPK